MDQLVAEQPTMLSLRLGNHRRHLVEEDFSTPLDHGSPVPSGESRQRDSSVKVRVLNSPDALGMPLHIQHGQTKTKRLKKWFVYCSEDADDEKVVPEV